MSELVYCDLEPFGFKGYRVGSDGTIWTKWLLGVRPMTIGNSWRLMKPSANQDGHLFVYLGVGPSRATRYVHHLVLTSFVGPRPPGMQARHYPDRDPSNNDISNLSWATALVNQRDRVFHGTHCRGTKCYAAKLTADQVRAVREEYKKGGIKQRDLAKKYGISQGPLWKILHRKAYADVI